MQKTAINFKDLLRIKHELFGAYNTPKESNNIRAVGK